EVWRAPICLGKRIDLRIIANDCSRAVILHQLPKAAGIPQKTVVGEVFARDKKGAFKLDYGFNGGATVKDWSKVKNAGSNFYWLSGTLGVPGNAPRYSADGKAVEFEVIDGKHQSIALIK